MGTSTAVCVIMSIRKLEYQNTILIYCHDGVLLLRINAQLVPTSLSLYVAACHSGLVSNDPMPHA